jgi:hypothetical protein
MIGGGTTPSVANAQPEAEHCLNPAGGDLNEFYGISDQIVAPFCPVANAGQSWIATSRWFVMEEFEAFPDGFEPAGDTPLEDFIAKFLGVTYVIDAGTKFEQSVFFPNNGTLFTTLEVGDCRFCVLVSPNTLGSLHPLSIGLHTVDLYWSFGALHCDGGGDINENCLAPGEHLFQTATFDVVPGHFGGPPPRE